MHAVVLQTVFQRANNEPAERNSTMFPLMALQINVLWYLFPLAAVISLVYSASRYELTERILHRAGRLFVTIVVFMAIVLVILMLLSRWL